MFKDLEPNYFYQHLAAEKNIIDCHHLNERQWIKVIAGSRVACVGNGCRRIIRHEYSAKLADHRSLQVNPPPMYGNRAQEIRHRNLSRNPTSKSIGKCVKKSDIGAFCQVKSEGL